MALKSATVAWPSPSQRTADRGPGVVEEVLRGDPSPRYRIRWDDGHETIYTPASGDLRAEQPAKTPAKAAPRNTNPT